jgi:hypothetical protein
MKFRNLNTLPDTRVPQASPLDGQQQFRALAYHEAGHAVVGMSVGMSLASIQLITMQRGGRTMRTASTTWNRSVPAEFDFAVQCAAGGVAETRHLHNEGLMRRSQRKDAPHDWDNAVAALREVGYTLVRRGRAPQPGATWAEVNAACEKAVTRYWRQIAAVAEALYASPGQRLNGQQAASAARMANPRPR